MPQAISRLEILLEQDPKNVSQRLILAKLEEEEGHVAKAAAAYEQILADHPEFVGALNNLAYLCAGPLEDLDRALELAAKARKLQPDSAAVADTLGWIHYQRKEYQQALRCSKKAASDAPSIEEIQYHLGNGPLHAGPEGTGPQRPRNRGGRRSGIPRTRRGQGTAGHADPRNRRRQRSIGGFVSGLPEFGVDGDPDAEAVVASGSDRRAIQDALQAGVEAVRCAHGPVVLTVELGADGAMRDVDIDRGWLDKTESECLEGALRELVGPVAERPRRARIALAL